MSRRVARLNRRKVSPPAPKPGRHPADPGGTHLTGAHLPGQPGKGGFGNKVKPVPLPGKSRGR